MRKVIRTIVLVVCIAAFCIAAYKLYDYYSEMKKGEETVDKLKNIGVTEIKQGEKAPISVDLRRCRRKIPTSLHGCIAKARR